MPDPERFPIIVPGKQPPMGMRSAADPASLPANIFAGLTGFRGRYGSLKVRNGHYKLSSAPPVAGASLRGQWSGTINGTFCIFAAYRVAGATEIWQLNTSTYAWTGEITEASGCYGSTRLATDGMVSFSAVRTRYGNAFANWGEVLVFTNGLDSPRSYNPTAASSHKCAPIAPVTLPNGINGLAPTLQGGTNILMGDPASTGYALTSAAHFTVAWASGGADLPSFSFVATTSTAAGEACTIDATAPQALTCDGRQWWVYVNEHISATQLSLLTRLKVEVLTSADNGSTFAWHTLYDPTTGIPPVSVNTTLGASTFTLYAFDMTSQPRYTDGTYLFQAVRFTWMTAAPAGTEGMGLYTCQDSGNVEGGASTAYTYMNKASHTQSPPVYNATAIGASLGSIAPSLLRYPVSSALFYNVVVPVQYPTAAELLLGVDAYQIYVELMGTTAWYAVKAPTTLNAYSGGAWPTTNALKYINVTISDQSDIDTTDLVPDDAMLPLGKASWILYTNNRLYAVISPELWISESGFPLRFAPIVRTDDTTGAVIAESGTVDRFAGEAVKAVVSVPTTFTNLASVVCFTDCRMWLIVGNDAMSLSRPSLDSEVGTLYPWTISQYKGNIYFVDIEKQVNIRKEGGGVQNLTMGVIDDILTASTLTNAQSLTTFDKFVLAYKLAGDTLFTRTLTLDLLASTWSKDVMGSGDCGGFLALQGLPVAFSDAGHVYQWEKPGQATDDGTAIPVDLLTGELNADMWSTYDWQQIGVAIDPVAASSLTTARITPAGSVAGVLGIASTDSMKVVWDALASGRTPGAEGITCQVQVSGSLPAGTRLRALYVRRVPVRQIAGRA